MFNLRHLIHYETHSSVLYCDPQGQVSLLFIFLLITALCHTLLSKTTSVIENLTSSKSETELCWSQQVDPDIFPPTSPLPAALSCSALRTAYDLLCNYRASMGDSSSDSVTVDVNINVYHWQGRHSPPASINICNIWNICNICNISASLQWLQWLMIDLSWSAGERVRHRVKLANQGSTMLPHSQRGTQWYPVIASRRETQDTISEIWGPSLVFV